MIDTNVISEARKKTKTNKGVTEFFDHAAASDTPIFLSAISLGELRRGVELLYHRGDVDQAKLLESWLAAIVEQFDDKILPFDADAAQVWGRLMVPGTQHSLDKQIAAIGLVNDLTVVTRNVAHFEGTSVKLRNPFKAQ